MSTTQTPLSAPIPFQFEAHAVRVQVDDLGQSWFNVSDVCDALEMGNPSQAIKSHVDAEDLQKLETLTAGGRQRQNHVNESGLYALILGSTKDAAKRFKRWVTGEVLPAIRKRGTYSVAPTQAAGVISEAQLKELQQLVHNVGFEFMWFKDSAVWQLWAGIRHQTGTSNRDIPLAQFDGIKAQLLAKKELACSFFRQQCDREAAFIKNVLRVPHAEYQAPLPDKEPQRAIYAEGLAKPFDE